MSKSLPQHILLYYLKQNTPDFYEEYRLKHNDRCIEGKELHLNSAYDAYSPSKKVVVEMDFEKNHSTKSSILADRQRNIQCQKDGITLVRIRDNNCPDISDAGCAIEIRLNLDDSWKKGTTAFLRELKKAFPTLQNILGGQIPFDLKKDKCAIFPATKEDYDRFDNAKNIIGKGNQVFASYLDAAIYYKCDYMTMRKVMVENNMGIVQFVKYYREKTPAPTSTVSKFPKKFSELELRTDAYGNIYSSIGVLCRKFNIKKEDYLKALHSGVPKKIVLKQD